MKYDIKDIKDYRDKITKEQAEKLIEHCNRYEIYPNICAWYDDYEDLVWDWYEHCSMDKLEVDEMYKYNQGEFVEFDNGEIVRLVV